jgi:elongation factor P
MNFEVIDTIGGIVKGNTANAITKEATIETGYTLQVPTFVQVGDKIRVSTEDGQYVERA